MVLTVNRSCRKQPHAMSIRLHFGAEALEPIQIRGRTGHKCYPFHKLPSTMGMGSKLSECEGWSPTESFFPRLATLAMSFVEAWWFHSLISHEPSLARLCTSNKHFCGFRLWRMALEFQSWPRQLRIYIGSGKLLLWNGKEWHDDTSRSSIHSPVDWLKLPIKRNAYLQRAKPMKPFESQKIDVVLIDSWVERMIHSECSNSMDKHSIALSSAQAAPIHPNHNTWLQFLGNHLPPKLHYLHRRTSS